MASTYEPIQRDLEDVPTRVLYVAGMGRSGSTLIERALAQIPGATGVGEVVFLWDRGLRRDERCGCGERFSACSFWQRVGKAAFGGWDQVDTHEMAALAREVDDLRDIGQLAGPIVTRRFRAQQRRYLEHYERLYAGIREVSGCDVVVDTSKLTPLAYNLRRSERIDLRVLQLVRDPRAVAYSWTKTVRRPEVLDREAYMPTYRPSYMAALWSGHNALLELLPRLGARTDRLRYEDFVADPRGSLRRVGALADLDVSGDALDFVTDGGLELGPVHTVSGNPSRFTTGSVSLRRDDAWRGALPANARRVVTALTWPGRRAYGYDATVEVRAEAPPRHEEVRAMGQQPVQEPNAWPSVGVVLVTHDRPALMRRALASICSQDYPGRLEVRVVFDRAEPDDSLETDAGTDTDDRRVRVLGNTRTPGLCGARNTGVLDLAGDLVAFCDDDDAWEPGKLRRQVAALEAEPAALFATTAMVVDVGGRSVVRTLGADRVRLEQLIRSRLTMLHSSSFLARRALVTENGLVDETLPQSMAEDWELLLRAAAQAPIVHVDEPLVRVQWGASSHFVHKWADKNAAHLVLLERYPAMARDRIAAGLMLGKLAFGHAALGERRTACRHAVRAARANWREPRWVLALAVVARLVTADRVMTELTRRGHGI